MIPDLPQLLLRATDQVRRDDNGQQLLHGHPLGREHVADPVVVDVGDHGLALRVGEVERQVPDADGLSAAQHAFPDVGDQHRGQGDAVDPDGDEVAQQGGVMALDGGGAGPDQLDPRLVELGGSTGAKCSRNHDPVLAPWTSRGRVRVC